MNTIIIGGGPAGILAAISASQKGDKVTILEKNNMLGKKLLITGKGRCNITTALERDEIIKNIPGNGKFLYSAINNFDNKDIINLLNKEGLKTKEERGARIFPVSDKSLDVLETFMKILKKYNVIIKTNSKVEEIIIDNNIVIGVRIGKNIIKADKIILATGGVSYPQTGSTGDGYKFAKECGHNITKIEGSLVPLELVEKDICKELQGLSLKNVEINIKDNEKVIYNDFGEMIFTHFGVSGPIIISASAHLVKYKNIYEKFREGNIKLSIDLKPALSKEKLDIRLLKDFEKFKNKEFKNSLDELLPNTLINVIIKLSKITQSKKVNEISKEERKNLLDIIKNLEFRVEKFRNIEDAIITSGGIDIKEINPKTMESKLVKGLYFAGEIIDVDAYTGGFNLQIAYSTGYTAGSK